MAKNKFKPGFLFICFLFAACYSINTNRTELGLPPSVVILSFDDGPNAHGDTTARLLDILKKYQIHALFSLLGENAEHNPDLARRIYDEGHTIVNHGYSDKWANKMNDDEFRENLARGEAAIASALGRDLNPKLYRPHGGFYSSRQEAIFREAGYTLAASNIRAHDAVVDGTKRRKVINETVKKTEKQNGGIILLHDQRDSHFRTEKELAKNPNGVFNREWIVETTEEIINILLEKGFVFGNPDIWLSSTISETAF